MSTEVTPPGFLKSAIKAVPAVRNAVGVGGIIAVIAIIKTFRVSPREAVFGTVIMLVLMAVLVLLGKFATLTTGSLHILISVFAWFCLFLFMATALCLFSSAFFGLPLDLRGAIASPHPEPRTKPNSPPSPTEGENPKEENHGTTDSVEPKVKHPGTSDTTSAKVRHPGKNRAGDSSESPGYRPSADEELCQSAKLLAGRIRDFQYDFEKAFNGIEEHYRLAILNAKNEAEKNALWTKQSLELYQQNKDHELQFRTEFIPPAKSIKDEIFQRLPGSVRARILANNLEANSNLDNSNLAGALIENGIATYLDEVAIALCPMNRIQPQQSSNIAIAPGGIANAGPNFGTQTVTNVPKERAMSDQQLQDFTVALGKARGNLVILPTSSADDVFPLANQFCSAAEKARWSSVCPSARDANMGNLAPSKGLECYSPNWNSYDSQAFKTAMTASGLKCTYFPKAFDPGFGIAYMGGVVIVIGSPISN